jgi:selenocysteine-specific elongation factor
MHVIGTAGHVDHGKSALVTRLTGIDPDRLAEEKRRGLTIDLGFAWLELPSGREIGLVDVPGHERFIKNMLAGAGSISICLFVVAANEGWMPQSAEHLSALDVLGVSHGVVALTKVDLVDDDMLELARSDVQEHLAHSSLAGAPIVPCSAITGAGIPQLLSAIDDVVRAAPPAPDIGRARLWVDRVFTIAGAGTVVTGTLAGGTFEAGEEVELRGPGHARKDRRARIRTIQSHKKEVSTIGPGNRVALNLSGLERDKAERGDAVLHRGRWRSTRRFDALVRVLPASLSGRDHELTEKGSHLLYVGSAETPVGIRLWDGERIRSGDTGFAQLTTADPLPLARGDRFVLRDAGRVVTFGGGEVLDPLAAPLRRRDGSRLELLARLRDAASTDALQALVEMSGSIDAAEASLRSGATEVPPQVVPLGGRLFSPAAFEQLRLTARQVLEDYHSDHPLESGMPRERLRAKLSMLPDVFESFIAKLDDVVAEGTVIRIASHRVVLDSEQQRRRDEISEIVHKGVFAPPLEKELPADSQLLRSLVDSGDLVRVGDFLLTRALAQEARRRVRDHIAAHGPMTIAEIRDLLGTTRKYAVPLCEWLDQTGATRRRGDVRVLGPIN